MSLRSFLKEYANNSPTRMRLRSGWALTLTPIHITIPIEVEESVPEVQYDELEMQVEAPIDSENQTPVISIIKPQ